jgi:hypothetical protein
MKFTRLLLVFLLGVTQGRAPVASGDGSPCAAACNEKLFDAARDIYDFASASAFQAAMTSLLAYSYDELKSMTEKRATEAALSVPLLKAILSFGASDESFRQEWNEIHERLRVEKSYRISAWQWERLTKSTLRPEALAAWLECLKTLCGKEQVVAEVLGGESSDFVVIFRYVPRTATDPDWVTTSIAPVLTGCEVVGRGFSENFRMTKFTGYPFAFRRIDETSPVIITVGFEGRGGEVSVRLRPLREKEGKYDLEYSVITSQWVAAGDMHQDLLTADLHEVAAFFYNALKEKIKGLRPCGKYCCQTLHAKLSVKDGYRLVNAKFERLSGPVDHHTPVGPNTSQDGRTVRGSIVDAFTRPIKYRLSADREQFVEGREVIHRSGDWRGSELMLIVPPNAIDAQVHFSVSSKTYDFKPGDVDVAGLLRLRGLPTHGANGIVYRYQILQ